MARNGLPPRPDPVVYFADDDNEYHPDLFRQLSTVKRLGMFPVAGSYKFELGDDG